MKLIVNGEEISGLPEGMRVIDLLAHLELPTKKIAVECNLEIVPKSTFAAHVLKDGDRLEIIHFIGGG